MMRRRLLATSVVSVLLVSACSSGSEFGERDTAPTIAPTSSRPAAPAVTTTSDLVYLTVDGAPLLMDVYAPGSGGPWPTVVAFHGRSSATKGSADMVAVAQEAASRGMVVFVPAWMTDQSLPITIDSIDLMQRAGNCAVAFAREHAREFGGDPALVALYGFSAGTGPAQRAALDPSDEQITGCASEAAPAPVEGVVLGDGEYFWHSGNFDALFRDHLTELQTTIATMVDPAVWPADLDARFRLWSAAEGTAPRALGEQGSEDDWLTARDPDGSIRRDLQGLGLLDDGIVDYADSARLLERRLASAGIDVELESFEGGHTSVDKAPAIVDALAATLAGT